MPTSCVLCVPLAIAIATAGRHGVGRAVCAQLRQLPLRALVYVACCLDPTTQDLALLLGRGGFCVAAALRFDHFPATHHQGAALLLLRWQPPSHTVAASVTYGGSLRHVRLQPPSHAGAASVTYGHSLRYIRS